MASVRIDQISNTAEAPLNGEAYLVIQDGEVTKKAAVSAMASSVTKSDVGLSEVDNTSDVNKPVSTATQAALTEISGEIANLNDVKYVVQSLSEDDQSQARENIGAANIWRTRDDFVAEVAGGIERPDGTQAIASGMIYQALGGATVISDLPGWIPVGDVTFFHFGMKADCNGTVGNGTDDSAAIAAGIAWAKAAPFRQITAPAGYRIRVAAAVTPNTAAQVGTRILLYSPIVPDASAFTAISIYSIRDGYVRLMVRGGGTDADYTVASPSGGSQAFDIRGCRRLHGEFYANGYAGRVLRVSAGGYYKQSFAHFTLEAADISTALNATPCGQGFYIDAAQSATGGFHYANTAWTKYGSVVDSAVDFSLAHWEAGSTHSPNEFRGCGSIWLGTVLAGDETQTQTLLRFTENAGGGHCQRVNIGLFQGVQAAIGIELDKLDPDGAGVTIHNMVTNQCFAGLKINEAGNVTVLNHESDADRNALVVTDSVAVLDYRASARAANRATVDIQDGVTGVIFLRGTSDSPSQSAGGTYPHVQYDSTAARMQMLDMVLTGGALSCVDAESTNYRCIGGRYVTTTKFTGSEPESIDHVHGVENIRSFTATILSGNTSVTVAHGLFNTPSYVQLTGQHAEVAAAVCTARDTTNITITVPSAVTADRLVDVIASRRP